MTDHTAVVLERARGTLAEMSELAGDQGHPSNPRRWDRLVDQWLADSRALADSDEGRAGVAALMTDPRPTVRLWCSAAVLFWDADAARGALTEIREGPGRYDLLAVIAKHTLREFDAGTLEPHGRLPGS